MKEAKETIKYMGKWLGLALCVGGVMGVLSAFFLRSLNFLTQLRMTYPLFLLGLPLVGFLFSYLYTHYGKNAQRGNNLVIEQANGEQEKIPLRLIPLTLFGTLATHLCGGSVGREGTAVQMGGSAADFFVRLFKLVKSDREVLIASGMAAGFSSVFGTPLAGTIFALEVLIVGKIRTEAIFPAFMASIVGNFVTEYLGVVHPRYAMGKIPTFTFSLGIKLTLAALLFGLVGRLFFKGIQLLKKVYENFWPHPVLRNTLGGVVVVLFALIFHGQRYLGISTELLSESFLKQQHTVDFIGKLFYTILSLGAGFQGGEVTPLFEIGATFGADLGLLLNVSVPFLAGLGYIGVFAAATNTPIACCIMGIELFGGSYAPYFFFICILAVLASGHGGIYASQFFPNEKYQHTQTFLEKD